MRPSKKYITAALVSLLILGTLTLTSCGEEKEVKVVKSDLGTSLSEEGFLENAGFKFTGSQRDLLLFLTVDNPFSTEKELVASWSYRERGLYNSFIETSRMLEAKKVTQLEFALESNKDFYPGEYMVEVFLGEELLTAHKFWVLPEEQANDNAVGIMQLGECSDMKSEELCQSQELCKLETFDVGEDIGELWACIPR